MRVALYQINSDRDTFNTKFMSWRWRTDHDYIILPEEYDKVFDGDIQARSLAEIFVLFNVMPPEGFVGHSASVSDVIAIYDENDNPSYHFVDSAGFVDVDFGMRYAVDALQKQDSPISIREYMAMANTENEKWFDVADTVTLNRITIGKIETKEVPSQYSSLYSLYHLIYDFGHDFSVTEWLEKDIRILVCGSSPYELDCCSEFLLKGSQSYTSHIISNNKVHYIFSFVPEEDMDDIKELMESEGDHTYFSAYTPDAFTLNAANNPIYAVITEAKNITPPQKKRRFLGFFSGEKSTEK